MGLPSSAWATPESKNSSLSLKQLPDSLPALCQYQERDMLLHGQPECRARMMLPTLWLQIHSLWPSSLSNSGFPEECPLSQTVMQSLPQTATAEKASLLGQSIPASIFMLLRINYHLQREDLRDWVTRMSPRAKGSARQWRGPWGVSGGNLHFPFLTSASC